MQATPGRQRSESSPMYVHTPLIESRTLAKVAGCDVYLKLENTQPCGSFKLRGISNVVRKQVERGCTGLVTASGGNAGMAATYTARLLGVPITVYVSKSISQLIKDRLEAEGAKVVVHGDFYDQANAKARQDAENDPKIGYVPAFDHPDVWEGHESLIVESAAQLRAMSVPHPDVVIVSVGGGGLMIGVSQGMDKVGWTSVPILAMETDGANCFNAAVKANQLVTLPAITSIASCLGALTVASEALRLHGVRPIISELISDKQCIEATCRFLDDHRILVEPACAAAVSAVYSGLIQRLQKDGRLPSRLDNGLLLIVCGGISVTADILEAWKTRFGVK